MPVNLLTDKYKVCKLQKFLNNKGSKLVNLLFSKDKHFKFFKFLNKDGSRLLNRLLLKFNYEEKRAEKTKRVFPILKNSSAHTCDVKFERL